MKKKYMKEVRLYPTLADLLDSASDARDSAKPPERMARASGMEIRSCSEGHGGEHWDCFDRTKKQLERAIEAAKGYANDRQERVELSLSGSYYFFDCWEDYYANDGGYPDCYWDVDYAYVFPDWEIPHKIAYCYPKAVGIMSVCQAYKDGTGWEDVNCHYTPNKIRALKANGYTVLNIQVIDGEGITREPDFPIDDCLNDVPETIPCPCCGRDMDLISERGHFTIKWGVQCTNLTCTGPYDCKFEPVDRTGYSPEEVMYKVEVMKAQLQRRAERLAEEVAS